MKYAGWLMAALLGAAGAPAALAVSIDVGSASGPPGQTVTFKVTLNEMGQAVGGVRNTITVDPETPLLKCTANPNLNSFFGASLFPEGCTAVTNCTSVSVAVISSSQNGFRDKVTLYTCQVAISEDAALGNVYPLVISDLDVSSPEPVHIPDATGTDGSIEVALPTATPTETETPLTPVPTPTVTRTRKPTRTPTDTPSATIPPTQRGANDSCQIVAPAYNRPPWLLLLPVAVLWGFRRRRR